MQAENYGDKESWIGALGKAMIKQSVLIDDEGLEDQYMWAHPEQMCVSLYIFMSFKLYILCAQLLFIYF